MLIIISPFMLKEAGRKCNKQVRGMDHGHILGDLKNIIN